MRFTRRIFLGLFVQYTKVLDTDAINASRLTGPFHVTNRMIVNRTAMMTGQPFRRTHFQSLNFIISALRRILTARLRQPLNASSKKNCRQNSADPIS